MSVARAGTGAGLAKLMVGGKAQRHYRRELAGAKLLTDQHLPTPALVGQGWQEGEGGWLLFDWLDSAKSLWESWRSVEAEPVLTDGQRGVLCEALELIAGMHAKAFGRRICILTTSSRPTVSSTWSTAAV